MAHRADVRKVTELDGSVVNYNYDDLGRLTSATRTGTNPYNQSYSYDNDDNRTSITDGGATQNATYDAANQMTSQGTVNYTYDRNGNMTAYSGNSLTYDASNKWTSGTVNSQSVSYGYDGMGRRVRQTVAGARTDQWYDATGMSLETGAKGVTYLRGPGGLESAASGGSVKDYSTDSLGSVTGLVSSSGSLTDSYSYKPYGEDNGSTGSSYNPLRYTGTYLDSTGLYQMGARYYDSTSGRFTQVDSVRSAAFSSQSSYAYVGGNPTSQTDPTGHGVCSFQVYLPVPVKGGLEVQAKAEIGCFPTPLVQSFRVCLQRWDPWFLWFWHWTTLSCSPYSNGSYLRTWATCKGGYNKYRTVLEGYAEWEWWWDIHQVQNVYWTESAVVGC